MYPPVLTSGGNLGNSLGNFSFMYGFSEISLNIICMQHSADKHSSYDIYVNNSWHICDRDFKVYTYMHTCSVYLCTNNVDNISSIIYLETTLVFFITFMSNPDIFMVETSNVICILLCAVHVQTNNVDNITSGNSPFDIHICFLLYTFMLYLSTCVLDASKFMDSHQHNMHIHTNSFANVLSIIHL